MDEMYHDPLIFDPIASEQGNDKLPLFSIAPLTTESNVPLLFFDMDPVTDNLYVDKFEDIAPEMSTTSTESTPDRQDELPEFLHSEHDLKLALQRVPMTPFKRRFIADPECRNNPMLRRKLTVRCPARGCGRIFQKVRDAVYHFDDHNEEDKNKDFLCPYEECPWGILGLSSKPSLCRHIGTVHEGHTIQCQRCWKEFKRLDGLTRHEQKNKCKPRVNPDSLVPVKSQEQLNDEMFDELQGPSI